MRCKDKGVVRDGSNRCAITKVETDGRMKAIASITIDDEFVVHDIRVIDGNEGLFRCNAE